MAQNKNRERHTAEYKPQKGILSLSNVYEPISLTDCICIPEIPCPNLKGVRPSYC
jgi:hypothetical protein